MKYKIGDKFYRYVSGRVLTIEIADIRYKLKGGRIMNFKYPSDEDIDNAILSEHITTTYDSSKSKAIRKRLTEIERLTEEIENIKKEDKR